MQTTVFTGAQGRNRTGTGVAPQRILSLVDNGLFSTFSGIYSGQKRLKTTENDLSTAGKRWQSFLIALFIFCAFPAHADNYIIMGIGNTVSYQPRHSNGLYYQDNYDHDTRTRDKTWSLGFGKRFSPSLRGEISYHAPSAFDLNAAFIGPDQAYDPAKETGCASSCPPTQYGMYHEEKSGISFTMMPSLKLSKQTEIYARLGGMYYKDSVEWRTTGCGDNCVPSTQHQFDIRDRPVTRGLSACFGAGIQIGEFGLDAMRCPGVRLKPQASSSDIGATDGINYISLTMKKEF